MPRKYTIDPAVASRRSQNAAYTRWDKSPARKRSSHARMMAFARWQKYRAEKAKGQTS